MRPNVERPCADCGGVRYRFDLQRTSDDALLCPDCYERFTTAERAEQ